MTFKQFIMVMLSGTIIFWLAFTVVLFMINPRQTNIWGLGFFYASLFFALLGTFSLFGTAIRVKINKIEPTFRLVITSYRQSIFFACLIISTLFLQSQRLLNWWNIIILILAVSLLEILFLSANKNYRS